jgi:hypothetical protein
VRAYLDYDHIVLAVEGILPALHIGMCPGVDHYHTLAQMMDTSSTQDAHTVLVRLGVVIWRGTDEPAAAIGSHRNKHHGIDIYR